MTSTPAHLLFKALGHPLRLALVYLMLRSGPLDKSEALKKLLQIFPGATHDQVDRQLRTLEAYGVVVKKPRLRKRTPGRTPHVYELDEQARIFYSRIIACITMKEPSDTVIYNSMKELSRKLAAVETTLYFQAPGKRSPLKKILDSTLATASLIKPQVNRILLPPLGCEEAQSIIEHPLFRVLLRRIPPAKLARIRQSTLLRNPGEACDCENEACAEEVTSFLQAVFDYLVLVEKTGREPLELLLLDTMTRNARSESNWGKNALFLQ